MLSLFRGIGVRGGDVMPITRTCGLALVLTCVTLSLPAQTASSPFAGMPGMQAPPSAAPASTATATAPAPQALGPKAPGKIRIGVAPAQAQMGQGNNSQEDFSSHIRNAIVLTMSGPAVEITPL